MGGIPSRIKEPMYRKVALFTFGCALAAACVGQDVKVEQYKLANGMAVILHEDHSQPIVAVNIWYRVGSKDEMERRSGFAHLFEHLMFMGTERVPNGKFDDLMEKYGGGNNASTTEDRTNYYESGPSQLLPTFLWLEADRLSSLSKAMDQKKLDLQREVVKNERREGVDNAPYGKAYDAIPGLMYPKGHPYATSVIGSMEDLGTGTVQNVKDFFDTYYVTNNASMVIAGDFDPKTTKALVQKYFGSIPRGNDIVRKPIPPVGLKGEKRVTMVDKVQAGKVVMVWHSPAAYKPGDVDLRLAGSLLSGGYTSPLYQTLVVQKELASDVSAYQASRLLGSNFFIDATAREGVSLERIEKEIDAVLANFKKKGPTKTELDRQLAQISFHSIDELQSLTQVADRLNEFQFYFGKPNSFAKEKAMYFAATPASIQKAVTANLDPGKRLILKVVPEGNPPTQDPLQTQPTVGATKTAVFPLPTEFTLKNGLRVAYWQKSDLPLTIATMRFIKGAAQDPASKAGLSDLVADMLDESAGNRNADAFSDALDQLGAQLSINADQLGTSITLMSLTDKFPAALNLMADAALRPKLAASDWERVKSLRLESLATEDDDPSTVARKVASREFFGKSHPYSRPVQGTAETVKALGLTDIKNGYAKLKGSGVRIFASGNLPAKQMQAMLEKAFGGMKLTATSASAAIPAISMQPKRLLIVDKPGAVQTVIRIQSPTESFDSPDRHALTELGVAMGGSFTSRLNRNLREDKGYTYGIGMNFAFSKPVSYTLISASVRSDVTGASLKEILKELDKAATGDLTADELDKSKSTFRVESIQAIGTRQGLVGDALTYAQNGITFKSVDAELKRFESVTQQDLNRLAASALRLDHAVIVLVGDKNQILPQLEGLGLPNPEIVRS